MEAGSRSRSRSDSPSGGRSGSHSESRGGSPSERVDRSAPDRRGRSPSEIRGHSKSQHQSHSPSRSRSRSPYRRRSRSPPRSRRCYRSRSLYSDDNRHTACPRNRVRTPSWDSDGASTRSSPRYGDYDDRSPPRNAPTGPSNPLAAQYIAPTDSRFSVSERLEDGRTGIYHIPTEYHTAPLRDTNDLRIVLKRGNIIAYRQVEFSYLSMNDFRTDYAFTSQGPVAVKWSRPFIIWEVFPRYLLGWWTRASAGKGLKVQHIDPSDYYKYLGLSTTGDGRGNDSPHEQMKINQRLGKITPSHVFAPELVKLELTMGWQFWGDVEPDSLWRLDALHEVCTDLRTTVLDDYWGLGLDIEALRVAQRQLPPTRPGYERPPRGYRAQQLRDHSKDVERVDPDNGCPWIEDDSTEFHVKLED